MLEYVRVSAERREDMSKLFTSMTRPHKQVTLCIVARWLKRKLADASIDDESHSFHGATSMKAAMSDAMLQDILIIADWSSKGMFHKFYYCPSSEGEFGCLVLRDGW